MQNPKRVGETIRQMKSKRHTGIGISDLDLWIVPLIEKILALMMVI